MINNSKILNSLKVAIKDDSIIASVEIDEGTSLEFNLGAKDKLDLTEVIKFLYFSFKEEVYVKISLNYLLLYFIKYYLPAKLNKSVNILVYKDIISVNEDSKVSKIYFSETGVTIINRDSNESAETLYEKKFKDCDYIFDFIISSLSKIDPYYKYGISSHKILEEILSNLL
jgi:hypothetical protein